MNRDVSSDETAGLNYSLLHLASQTSSAQVVEILLRHGGGANLNVKDALFRNTPLEMARQRGASDIAQVLQKFAEGASSSSKRQKRM